MQQIAINGIPFNTGDLGRILVAGVTTVALETAVLWSSETTAIDETDTKTVNIGTTELVRLGIIVASGVLGAGFFSGILLATRGSGRYGTLAAFGATGLLLGRIVSEVQSNPILASVIAAAATVGLTSAAINVEAVARLIGKNAGADEIANGVKGVAFAIGIGTSLGFERWNGALLGGLIGTKLAYTAFTKTADLTTFAITKLAERFIGFA